MPSNRVFKTSAFLVLLVLGLMPLTAVPLTAEELVRERFPIQGQVQLAANPNDANQIVAAANPWTRLGRDCGDFGLQAVFYSSDGGHTWGSSCPPDHQVHSLSASCADLGGDAFVFDQVVVTVTDGRQFNQAVVQFDFNGEGRGGAVGTCVEIQ